jgi:hypothetical protein
MWGVGLEEVCGAAAVLIHCCATPYSATRGPFDHFEIRVSTNLEVIKWITCYAARCCAAVDMNSVQRYCM